MSIGLRKRIKIRSKQPGRWTGSLPELYQKGKKDLLTFAKAVARLKHQYRLDDYGIFRVAWSILEQLNIRTSNQHRTLKQALYHKDWSLSSRLIALTCILRGNGLRVIPAFHGQQTHLLFDVGDEYDILNSIRMTYTSGNHFTIRAVCWDGKSRFGEGTFQGQAEFTAVQTEQTLRPLQFRNRTIPVFTKTQKESRNMKVYGHRETIGFTYYPHVEEYLRFFPSFTFGEHIELAWQEAKLMGFKSDLLRFKNKVNDEVMFITSLCRSIQDYTKYTPGPLRSLFTILKERKGDCDQLSMLMSALLLESGYVPRDIIGCHWKGSATESGHILIGIRPQKARLSGASFFHIDKVGTYYCLDSTYYVRGYRGDIKSTWGNISSDYKGQCHSVPINIRNIV